MDIKLHANATTTPKMRAYIQSSTLSVAELSRELGISETCVRRWRSRTQTSDRSHTRHDLGQSTSPEEEALICALRRDVRLSIDDTVEVMHRCVNARLSRSAIYRCMVRHGLSRLPDEAETPARPARFEASYARNTAFSVHQITGQKNGCTTSKKRPKRGCWRRAVNETIRGS
jgi:transposase-like protein